MEMKKNWTSPSTVFEAFYPNEYIAACETQTVQGTITCAVTGTELTAKGTKYGAGDQSIYGPILSTKPTYNLNAVGTENVGAGGVLYEEYSYQKDGKTYYAYNGQLNDDAHSDLTHPSGYAGEFFTGTTSTQPDPSVYVYTCEDCGFIAGSPSAPHHHVEFGYKVIANPS